MLSRLIFALALVWATTTSVFAAPPGQPDQLQAPPPIVIAVGPEEAVPIGEILGMETDHLLALGVGVVAGATVIAPYLEISELTGVIIGIIGGDLIYRLVFLPFHQSRSWF